MAFPASTDDTEAGIRVLGVASPDVRAILTPDALLFLRDLVREMGPRLEEVLNLRQLRSHEYRCGVRPRFRPETRMIRESEWRVAPAPADLLDRRVEIVGPLDRRSVIDALNSGATGFMADFEDGTVPTWERCLEGQVNLRDAVTGSISVRDEVTGVPHTLSNQTAVLIVRPRGWHLREAHVEVDGRPVPAALFDYGLFVFHNARRLLDQGSGPYFYLPKLEGYVEARLWNDVFLWTELRLGLRAGSIKATVLIETLPAVFEMDEILFELRDHCVGLGCGHQDYVFSFSKVLGVGPRMVVPEPDPGGARTPFLRAYACSVVRTCHRRGVHAIGGIVPQVPVDDDPEAHDRVLSSVRSQHLAQVARGFDGTVVAHPAFVPVARDVFDTHVPGPNQIGRPGPVEPCVQDDLLRVPAATVTEESMRREVRDALRYLESWLSGTGRLTLEGRVADLSAVEVIRMRVWQWFRHGPPTEATGIDARDRIDPTTPTRIDARDRIDPTTPTGTGARDRIEAMVADEVAALRESVGPARFDAGRFEKAAQLFLDVAASDHLIEFLTLPAYRLIVSRPDGDPPRKDR